MSTSRRRVRLTSTEKEQIKAAELVSTFTKILRHTAPKNNLHVHPGGFIYLNEILDNAGLMLSFTTADVKHCVATTPDQRFEIKMDEISKKLLIRAKSGHSFPFEPLDVIGTRMDAVNGHNVLKYDDDVVASKMSEFTFVEKEKLVKTVYWLLTNENLKESDDSYVDLELLLQTPQLKCLDVFMEDIIRIIDGNSRFEVRKEGATGKAQVRIIHVGNHDADLKDFIYRIIKQDALKHDVSCHDYCFYDVDDVVKLSNDLKLGRHFTKEDFIETARQHPDSFLLRTVEESHALQIRILTNVENTLRRILNEEAPQLGLTVLSWGFISIEEIISLKRKEFEGISLDAMVDYIENISKKKPGLYTIRRNPDNPKEIGVRINKDSKFVTPPCKDIPKEFFDLDEDKKALSKRLSYLLRHAGCHRMVDRFGYIELDILLKQSEMRRNCHTETEIVSLLELEKQQFEHVPDGIIRHVIKVDETTGKKKIRATYGHSFPVTSVEGNAITSANEFQHVVFGCDFHDWSDIKKKGIPRSTLSHIHLAEDENRLTHRRFVYYATRKLIDVIIFINMDLALSDGLKFFHADNGVILCRGNEYGFIEPKYILRAVDVVTGLCLVL